MTIEEALKKLEELYSPPATIPVASRRIGDSVIHVTATEWYDLLYATQTVVGEYWKLKRMHKGPS